MALPDGVLSDQAIPAPVIGAAYSRNRHIAREQGGIALNDASKGLLYQTWTLEWNRQTGDFELSAPNHPPSVLFNRINVTEVSLAFDRNMNLAVVWVESGQAKLYWYDSTIPGMTTWETQLGAAVSPRITHDDKREGESAVSDIILSYIKGGNLYYRQQRDRYGTEYLLASGLGPNARLVELQMNRKMRLQWRISNANRVSRSVARIRPTLADIVLDLCARTGIGEQQVDVDDLWDVEVGGYLVASEQTPADIITQLQGIYFFDVAEYDGKVHFIARGREPVALLTIDDMVERDGDAVTITEVQEVELLRKLTFNYKDMANGLGTNNAAAERRAATVNAKAEKSTEAPVSMYPTEAKQTVEIAINAQWAERKKYEFTLYQRHSFITDGDDVWLKDIRGDVHRIRMTRMLRQDGTIECTAITSAPWAYSSDVQASPSPSGTGSGGTEATTEADFIVMNLPSWDGSDEIGFYIASWDTPVAGCDVQIMASGGALAISDVGDLTDRATVGILTAPLAAEVGAEYLSQQTITLALMGDAEGLTQLDYDALLQYEHLAALEHTDGTWEILQFEDATVNADYTYTLSGLIRGRYQTNPAASAAGCRLVLLDSAVEFIQVAPWHKDLALQVRAIAMNSTKGDDWGWEQPALAPWAVQTEWPPTDVAAVRDGGNTVTVTWTPRPRLGVETNPLQSKYFTGYRVAYSDGVTADLGTADTSHTRASVPAGVTVTVAALNSITGAGPASSSIPT
ncbi:hypothetical protein GGR77_001503 [Xanthomonas translucens]